MGLAPYGDYKECKGVLDKYFPSIEKCHLIKKTEFGDVYYWNESGIYQWHFDEAYEIEKYRKIWC